MRRAFRSTVLLAVLSVPGAVQGQSIAEKDLGKPTKAVKDGFTRASFAIELADGRLLFADASSDGNSWASWSRLDFNTGKIERMLTSGPADNQFRAVSSPMRWTGDSIAVADLVKARLTILAPDGSFGRAIKLGEAVEAVAPASGAATGGAPAAGAPPRGPRVPLPRFSAAPTTLFGTGFAPRPQGLNPVLAPPRLAFPIVRFSIANLTFDTVTQLLPVQSPRPPQRNNETGAMTISIPTTPFQAVDSWVAFGDGTVAVVRATPYRVDLIASDGARTQGEAIPFPKVAVNDEDKKQYMSSFKKSTEESISRAATSRSPIRSFLWVEPTTWPATHPPFRSDYATTLGSDERIWLTVRCESDEKATCFDVLERTGVRAARYKLPPRSRLLAAGKDAIYILNESKGDQVLERFALR